LRVRVISADAASLEKMPHHAIAALADLSGSVDLVRLIDARCQAEMRTDCFRNVEPAKIIDRRLERETGHGARHPAPSSSAASSHPDATGGEGSILRFAFDLHAFAHAQQRFDRRRQFGHRR
jgi:hypothetical protein